LLDVAVVARERCGPPPFGHAMQRRSRAALIPKLAVPHRLVATSVVGGRLITAVLSLAFETVLW